MKEVGNAVRDYGIDESLPTPVLIGIAPWGKVKNRTNLIRVSKTYFSGNEKILELILKFYLHIFLPIFYPLE